MKLENVLMDRVGRKDLIAIHNYMAITNNDGTDMIGYMPDIDKLLKNGLTFRDIYEKINHDNFDMADDYFFMVGNKIESGSSVKAISNTFDLDKLCAFIRKHRNDIKMLSVSDETKKLVGDAE